jgi:hypothetical protein
MADPQWEKEAMDEDEVLLHQGVKTYDWEFLAPLALPPDLPPPVILMDVFGWWKKVSVLLSWSQKD